MGIFRKKTVWRFKELGVGVMLGLRGAHFTCPFLPAFLPTCQESLQAFKIISPFGLKASSKNMYFGRKNHVSF
jgi:hypothetical protein